MWRAILFLALVACETSTGAGSVDASIDAFDPCRFVLPPPADQACAHTCGNNSIDTCWIPELDPQTHCQMAIDVTETCDGVPRRCIDDGYFGGSETCDSCQLDTTNCEVCAPNDLACITLPTVDNVFGIATNQTQIAIASSNLVTLYDAATLRPFSQASSASPLDAIVGVPGGFLVTTYNAPTVFLVNPQGQFLPGGQIDSGGSLPALVYAPASNTVLVAWAQDVGNGTWMIRGQILLPNGQTLVPSFTMFTGNPTVTAATDGTAFFVGSQGILARVLSDGTVTSVTGVASSANATARVFWGGSTGWQIVDANGITNVTKFDATGAFVGPSFGLGQSPSEVTADGNALVALQFASMGAAYKVQLVRIDASGPGAAVDIGATEVPQHGYVRRYGSALIAVWRRYLSIKLARVTPL